MRSEILTAMNILGCPALYSNWLAPTFRIITLLYCPAFAGPCEM